MPVSQTHRPAPMSLGCPGRLSLTVSAMNQAQLGEEALVAAAQQGDEGAFETLVRSRRGELPPPCYRLLASPDDADDAVQEAIVRAWRSLEGFEHRSSFRTWLFR